MKRYNDYFRNVLNEAYAGAVSKQLLAVEYTYGQDTHAVITDASDLKETVYQIVKSGEQVLNVYKVSGKVKIPDVSKRVQKANKEATGDHHDSNYPGDYYDIDH